MLSEAVFNDWNQKGYEAESIRIPTFITKGSSRNLIALIADDSEKFRQYGIVEGMILIIDLDAPFRVGELSCYRKIDSDGSDEKRYIMSATAPHGYDYIGGLAASMRNYSA